MHLMDTYGRASDEGLTRRAAEGNRAAFVELFDRNYGALHDFAVRAVREQAAAGAVIERTFGAAWLELSRGRRPADARAWLFDLAQAAAVRTRRSPRGNGTNGHNEIANGNGHGLDVNGSGNGNGNGNGHAVAPAAFARLNVDDPEGDDDLDEMASLVWAFVEALPPKDYVLLDLHVRRGVEPHRPSRLLTVPLLGAHTKLAGLRSELEETVAVGLLSAHPEDCDKLASIVGEKPGADASRRARRAVSAHLDTCERCRETIESYESPYEVSPDCFPCPPPREPATRSGTASRSRSGMRIPSRPSGRPTTHLPPRTRHRSRPSRTFPLRDACWRCGCSSMERGSRRPGERGASTRRWRCPCGSCARGCRREPGVPAWVSPTRRPRG